MGKVFVCINFVIDRTVLRPYHRFLVSYSVCHRCDSIFFLSFSEALGPYSNIVLDSRFNYLLCVRNILWESFSALSGYGNLKKKKKK